MIKKKQSFLLIEVLIAMSLIMLCSIPLMRNPIYLLKSQVTNLELMEFERIADLSFLEIKLKLYKNEIFWNKTATLKKADAQEELLESYPLSIKNLPQKSIKRSYKITQKTEKIDDDGNIYRLINIWVFLYSPHHKKPHEYKYKALIKKAVNLNK